MKDGVGAFKEKRIHAKPAKGSIFHTPIITLWCSLTQDALGT